jgi:hypothetical protein
LAPDIGGKEKRSMKNKIRYTDEPMGDLRVVRDFLPPPDQLVLKEDTVKVTISLSKSSVEFFKNVARQHQTQYQRMIRHLLDLYAREFKGRPLTRRSTRRASARR